MQDRQPRKRRESRRSSSPRTPRKSFIEPKTKGCFSQGVPNSRCAECVRRHARRSSGGIQQQARLSESPIRANKFRSFHLPANEFKTPNYENKIHYNHRCPRALADCSFRSTQSAARSEERRV